MHSPISDVITGEVGTGDGVGPRSCTFCPHMALTWFSMIDSVADARWTGRCPAPIRFEVGHRENCVSHQSAVRDMAMALTWHWHGTDMALTWH